MIKHALKIIGVFAAVAITIYIMLADLGATILDIILSAIFNRKPAKRSPKKT